MGYVPWSLFYFIVDGMNTSVFHTAHSFAYRLGAVALTLS